MEHNTGDKTLPANQQGKAVRRAPKILAAAMAALAIALIAFTSGYLGVKLGGALPANQNRPGTSMAGAVFPTRTADITQTAYATQTADATQPTATPQATLPTSTAEDQGQWSTQVPLSTPDPTPIARETAQGKYPADEVVQFTDKVVEQIIRSTLNKPEGDITAADMLSITTFKYDPVNDKSATGTISTLADLRYCEYLETLRVLHQPVDSIECLRELDRIKDVCILGCSVSDLSPLAGKESLLQVWISGNPVTDASPVLSLPNLQEFNAYYGTGIKDISSLSDSGNLKYFFCPNQLIDYQPLFRQKNIQGVVLSGVSDGFFLELISNCKAIRSICLDHSPIKDESLLLLKGRVMYNLYLESCGIKDISALADLAGVTDLRLDNNQIEDISALKGLTEISYVVSLANNKIKDLSPLENLTKVQILNVMGNPYTDGTVLDKLAAGGCKITR